MKTFLASIAFLVITSVAQADVPPPLPQVSITGAKANQLALLLPETKDADGTYAAGQMNVSCVRKNQDRFFTCTMQRSVTRALQGAAADEPQ